MSTAACVRRKRRPFRVQTDVAKTVLGDGGPRHQDVGRGLIAAGAHKSLNDREGQVTIVLARSRGYDEIVRQSQSAGAPRAPWHQTKRLP